MKKKEKLTNFVFSIRPRVFSTNSGSSYMGTQTELNPITGLTLHFVNEGEHIVL